MPEDAPGIGCEKSELHSSHSLPVVDFSTLLRMNIASKERKREALMRGLVIPLLEKGSQTSGVTFALVKPPLPCLLAPTTAASHFPRQAGKASSFPTLPDAVVEPITLHGRQHRRC